MRTETILLIILAFIIAMIIAIFQYVKKAKKMTKMMVFFAFLRFLTVFTLLLLIINPSLKQKVYYSEKPVLVIANDNSLSIKHLKQDEKVQSFLEKIEDNEQLKEHFDVRYYSFSDAIKDTISTTFDEKQTNILKALDEFDQIYKNAIAPIVMITDGNQTYGKDYETMSLGYQQPVYPIITGDTIPVIDSRIHQLNVNKYAYLKNKFPVEAILTYSGDNDVTSEFQILSGKNVVYSESVKFSKDQNSTILNFTLPASAVGILQYEAKLVPLSTEKNKINNVKKFAVEVIDQKTNIALISDMVHPDLGAIKKSVESNERRSLSIIKPSEFKNIDDYQLVILYQPNSRFRSIFKSIKEVKKNYFVIGGSKTDWNFLNAQQNGYKQEITRQTEYYLPQFNPNYGSFLFNDINFDSYPPLIGPFGVFETKSNVDVLLYRNVNTIETTDPLLLTLEQDGIKQAVLLGEGIWRWRAQSYLNAQQFKDFDDFFSKLIQYLGGNTKKSRLNTISESFYYGNADIIIKAEYFTKNYEFDSRGSLGITVRNTDSNSIQTIPMLLKNNAYEVDLSSLLPGNYEYTVNVRDENISRSGNFVVLEYNVEQQFLNANVTKLRQLATNTNGKTFNLDQDQKLIQNLIEDKRYQTIQKSKENTVSIIDWKYLLGLLIFFLALEWFGRKYNGLI